MLAEHSPVPSQTALRAGKAGGADESGAGHVYASAPYALTLSHIGQPLSVPPWKTTALLRPIPGASGRVDAMGPYPVCVLARDADIPDGLQALRAAGAVSVVLVADPLCGPDAAMLARHFSLCRPFKTHHLIDRRLSPFAPSKHHRERIRRGERRAAARVVSLRDPVWQRHWQRLYGDLMAHRGITGLQAFSAKAFDALAALPEGKSLTVAAESPEGEILAMQIWLRHGDHAYSHLTATSEAGYRALATYVVYAAAIESLADCSVLDLGGGAGAVDDPHDTLATFKQGFANTVAVTQLCGAVLDASAYCQLADGFAPDFFPAYRGRATTASG